jgi:hypothetical protein
MDDNTNSSSSEHNYEITVQDADATSLSSHSAQHNQITSWDLSPNDNRAAGPSMPKCASAAAILNSEDTKTHGGQNDSFKAKSWPAIEQFPLSNRNSDSSINSLNHRQDIGFSISRTNATFSMVQRTGKEEVKKLIHSIDSHVQQQQQSLTQLMGPVSECEQLVTLAQDDYYRVVISSLGGIEAITRAMVSFQHHEALQAYACMALGNSCEKSTTNQSKIFNCDGLSAILTAVVRYPLSAPVQATALKVIMRMSNLEAAVEFLLGLEGFYEWLFHLQNNSVLPDDSVMSVQIILQRLEELSARKQSSGPSNGMHDH